MEDKDFRVGDTVYDSVIDMYGVVDSAFDFGITVVYPNRKRVIYHSDGRYFSWDHIPRLTKYIKPSISR